MTINAVSAVVNAAAAMVAVVAAVVEAKVDQATRVKVGAKVVLTSAVLNAVTVVNAQKGAMANAVIAMPRAATRQRAKSMLRVWPAAMDATTKRAPSVPSALMARAPARAAQSAAANAAAVVAVVIAQSAASVVSALTARPAIRKSRISHWRTRRPWLRP